MSKLKELQVAVDALPKEEYGRFRRWFLEGDWEKWDRQVEADSASGKLDFLVREAREAKDFVGCDGDRDGLSDVWFCLPCRPRYTFIGRNPDPGICPMCSVQLSRQSCSAVRRHHLSYRTIIMALSW